MSERQLERKRRLEGTGGRVLRVDEIDWFERISDRAAVLWLCGKATYLYHATTDGKISVCRPHVNVDRERDSFPHVTDRSNDTMSCQRCQELVRRVKLPAQAGRTR